MTIVTEVQTFSASLDAYKKNMPTIDQLQDLAAKLWELNLKYTDSEKSTDSTVQNALNSAFDKFSTLLDSAWHVDASLIEPYSRLVSCRNLLVHLKARGAYSNAEVTRIQEEVNAVENKYFKEGKFSDYQKGSNSEIVMGQAVMSTLLYHCHRLAAGLLAANEPVNAYILPIHQKLVRINAEITKVDYAGLQVLQEELKTIEQAKKNGLFVPADWDSIVEPNAIPEGQAECQALMEECYNKIYERLCEDEKSDLSRKMESVGSSHGGYEMLQKYIWDGITSLENLALTASKEAVRLGYAIAKGYSELNKHLVKNLSSTDVVDPKLSNVMAEIQSILSGLKKARVEALFLKGETKTQGALKQELGERIQKLRERLNAVDARRVNGRFLGDDGAFAPKGQAVLASMLEEGYAILQELTIILN